MNKAIFLGVNIDHIATVRQARGTRYPDPVLATFEAEQAGADGITLHLREDLRHIQKRDVHLVKQVLTTRMNLEVAITPLMLDFAEEIKPEHVCFVPEKREELTTEGGLDVVAHFPLVQQAVNRLQALGIEVSLFIDPSIKQVDGAVETGAKAIELHTGCYADALFLKAQQELERIEEAAFYAHSKGLTVNAGHGLHYHNVQPVAAITVINELNIGHAIVARALFCGFSQAVKEMRHLMQEARHNATT